MWEHRGQEGNPPVTTADALAFYARPGALTAAGEHLAALRTLPSDVPGLLEALHGILIHPHLTWAYGVEHRPDHDETAGIRPAGELLGRILADGRGLTEVREPAERVGGTCRHFAVLTVAALRAHGRPARARCGFGAYFPVPTLEDHWVAEYWDPVEGRWALADAQIDRRQRELFGIGRDLDLADVPRDRFVVAGQAWRRCRNGEDDPARYGLHQIQEFGAWWIAGNLIRDVAALAGREMLPWDVWGAMPEPEDEIGPDVTALLDELAALTVEPDTAAEVRAVYHGDDRLAVPRTLRDAGDDGDGPAGPGD